MVNQILAHVGNMPEPLIEYSKGEDILVEAYSPIGHGAVLDNAEIARIADGYGVSVPRLSIRYLLQRGLLPLPKTENPEHMKDNAEVDFTISEKDMEALSNVGPITDYGDANVMPVFGGTPGS